VPDLDVPLASQRAVGGIGGDPDRLAVARQQRLDPGVRLDLRRVGALVPVRWRSQVAGDVPRRDPVAAQQQQREVREVLADAGAGLEQLATVDPTYVTPGRYSNRSGMSSASARTVASGPSARDAPTSSSSTSSSGSPSVSRNSPATARYAGSSSARHGASTGFSGAAVFTRARTSIDRWSCGREMPNSITVVPK
jgi:hypothetical protein